VTGHGYQFAIASNMNCERVNCTWEDQCVCYINGSSVHEKDSGKSLPAFQDGAGDCKIVYSIKHISVFSSRCGIFYPPGLGRVEAMVFAVEQINKNDSILQNITLGYDIRDFCQDPVTAAGYGYQFAIASNMDCETVKCTWDNQCVCYVNGSSVHEKHPGKDYSTTFPVAAIVGALTSSAAIPLANFLQAVRIPLIDSSATSEELSSSIFHSFFRTIPPDVNQAKAIADIIEHFNWR
jgi:metabotropic glutamate receptor 6/7/8